MRGLRLLLFCFGLILASTNLEGGKVLEENQAEKRQERNAAGEEPQQRIITLFSTSRMPSLGELYISKSETLLTSVNLWHQSTLKNHTKIFDATYARTDLRIEESLIDRMKYMKIEAGLKLSFFGGLFTVSGSMAYVKDTKLTENILQMGLHFWSTNKMRKMPSAIKLDFPENCAVEGATHFVSAVTYGLNAHLIFEKSYSSYKERAIFEGGLKAGVRSVPGASAAGSSGSTLSREQHSLMRQASVKFYGDILLSSPTSFEDAIEIYQKLPGLARASDRIISYTLTPLKHVCSGNHRTLLKSISKTYIDKVTKIMDDFTHIEEKINTLAKSTFSSKFDSYANIIETLRSNYINFKNEIREELAIMIPAIRSGENEAIQLANIFNKYSSSKYSLPMLQAFFGTRKKETNSR